MIFESVEGEGPEEKDGEGAARGVYPASLKELGLNLFVDQGGYAQGEVQSEQRGDQAADDESVSVEVTHLFTPTLQCPVPPSQGPYGHHMQE